MSKYSQSLDEMDEWLNILYYGEPGSGKTSAAASMAHLGVVYLVDVESGAKARPLRKLGVPTKNIRPVQVTSYKELDEFYWFLKQELQDLADARAAAARGEDVELPPDIAGVVFDSISEIHDQLIRAQVDVRHGKAVKKATNKHGELAMEVDDNEFMVELGDRGIVTEQLRTLTRRFRDLPCHCAWVALAKREVDPGGEGVVYLPQLPPKFGQNLRGFVDVVGYMVKAPGVEDASGYLGVFRDTGRYKGKDRFGTLPEVLAHPAFQRVVATIFEEIDLGTDPAQSTYLKRVYAATVSEDPEPDETTLGENPDD